MTCTEVIEQILTSRTELSREELLDKLENERAKSGGLISDDTLLRMIAAQYGIEVPEGKTVKSSLSVWDLVPGLDNVTFTGRIVAVYPPKTFSGRKPGKFASLLLADRSDILRVVFWNDQTSLIESDKVQVDQILRIIHAYTKEGRSETTELHVSGKSLVEIDPEDVDAEDYPSIDRFSIRINAIEDKRANAKVHVHGTVNSIQPASTFERQDSTVGRVLRFGLADETGEVAVVAWNEKADELEAALKPGVRVQLVNGTVKKTAGNGSELSVNGSTYVQVKCPEERLLSIADLKDGMINVDIRAQVAGAPVLREVETSRGETVRLAVVELKDNTGSIWLSAWRTHSEAVAKLTPKTTVTVKNASVKKGFGDQLEVSTRTSTTITECENEPSPS